MNREKKLIKNTIILSFGNLFTKLITFFLLPLYTSILTTAEYGVVDLLNTLVSLLLPIVTFQIEQAVFRYLIEKRDSYQEKCQIISTTIITVFFQSIIYLILFFILSSFIDNKYKIFLATNVIAYIFASLFQQIARGFGDNKTYTVSSIFSGVFTIIFNVFFLVVIRLNAYGMLIGTMVGQIACIVFLTYKLEINKYFSVKKFDKKLLKKMWKYSLPLVPNSISWWVFNASDRVIVSIILGLGMTGILSASNKFATLYIMAYNFFHLSWLETISLHIKDNDIKIFFNNIFNKVLKIFISIALGIIGVMPFVYPLMINSKFFDGYYQVPIIMVGSVLNVIVALDTAIYVAYKDTKSIAITSGIAALINIIIHLLLINVIGLYASSLSTLIAYLLMLIFRHYDIKKKYCEIRIDLKIIISSLFVLGLIIPLYYSKKIGLHIVGFIIVIIYAILINKNLIYSMLKYIKKRIG